jgi:glutamate/tyrosine decarboxylase-like PLP-dependent enzyme
MCPEYLSDVECDHDEVNFFNRGPELSRPFRALGLWLTLQALGSVGLGRAIDKGFGNAEIFERMIGERPGWEVVSPAQMAIVCFRYRGCLDERAADGLNQRLAARMIAGGTAMVSSTIIRGRIALRACPIHPDAQTEDLRLAVEALDAAARKESGTLASHACANSQMDESEGLSK